MSQNRIDSETLMSIAGDVGALLCLGAVPHLAGRDGERIFQVFRNWSLDRRRVNEWRMLVAGRAWSEKAAPDRYDDKMPSGSRGPSDPAAWRAPIGAAAAAEAEQTALGIGWVPTLRKWLDVMRQPAQDPNAATPLGPDASDQPGAEPGGCLAARSARAGDAGELRRGDARNRFPQRARGVPAEPGRLTPAPASVGIAEPAAAGDAPAIALSLPAVQRLGPGGSGGGIEPMSGALAVDVAIDLAAPFLPDLPGFSLVGADRLSLILPHGGLVRADGDTGPLAAADFSLTVAGAPRPLMAPPPAGDGISVDPLQGIVTFATALPAAGTVAAHYHIGSWERRTTLLGGELRLAVYAAAAADVEALSVAATRALLNGNVSGPPGLRSLALGELGAIAPPPPAGASLRSRIARFQFKFEHVVDDAFSSGGIIRSIPIATTLNALRIDPATGLEGVESVTETR